MKQMNVLGKARFQGIDLGRHVSGWSDVEYVWYRVFLLWSEFSVEFA
jgi:hypothetical protein